MEAPASARTAVHCLQKETVSRAAVRRIAGREVLLVQEVLHLLISGPLQLKDTAGDGMIDEILAPNAYEPANG